MQAVLSLVANVVCLTVVTVAAEYTVPSGRIKQAASVSMGLVFLSAVTEQILGLFARMGG